ncbi:MAG TPA: OB-fold nucleic acid binding domain-containing protein, partial [Aggregatilineales bacterium]|nr:OB-fold nucleic acid binding domain-containing protein [Aggregatilineales bacterium]
RQFARSKLANLEPSREPKLMAGVIAALRTQMTQRGKMIIVTLDDGTATVDVTVYNEVFDANKALFKEDEFLAVQGKVSEDRFSGGLRITAEKVMDIAGIRQQFARSIGLNLSDPINTQQFRELIEPYRMDSGLPIALRYRQSGVECELRLADAWKVAPSDDLRQILEARFGVGLVAVEY